MVEPLDDKQKLKFLPCFFVFERALPQRSSVEITAEKKLTEECKQ